MGAFHTSGQKIDFILANAGLFASSYGLAPYRVFLLKDAGLNEKWQSGKWAGQTLTPQSQVVVFATEREISRERIDSYIAGIADRKKVSVYTFLTHKKYLESHINLRDKEGRNWASKQAGLAAANLINNAGKVDVKATLVEEDSNSRLDEILGLPAKKLATACAVILEADMEAGADPIAVMGQTGNKTILRPGIENPLRTERTMGALRHKEWLEYV